MKLFYFKKGIGLLVRKTVYFIGAIKPKDSNTVAIARLLGVENFRTIDLIKLAFKDKSIVMGTIRKKI